MGQSTDGSISYGVVIEEGTELPWEHELFNGDEFLWWREVNGYENPHWCPYDGFGNYKEGVKESDPGLEEKVSKYHRHTWDWEKENPMPVDLVNYCSAGLSTLRDRRQRQRASLLERSSGVRFDPKNLTVPEESRVALMKFLDDYAIEYEGSPGWLLTSYWG